MRARVRADFESASLFAPLFDASDGFIGTVKGYRRRVLQREFGAQSAVVAGVVWMDVSPHQLAASRLTSAMPSSYVRAASPFEYRGARPSGPDRRFAGRPVRAPLTVRAPRRLVWKRRCTN